MQPRVSPYRLAAHLTSAFGIYSGLLWTARVYLCSYRHYFVRMIEFLGFRSVLLILVLLKLQCARFIHNRSAMDFDYARYILTQACHKENTVVKTSSSKEA